MPDVNSMQGKKAIVTGGGSGFGAGIVKKFVAEGAQVIVADLNFEAALDIAAAAGAAARDHGALCVLPRSRRCRRRSFRPGPCAHEARLVAARD